jgi:hypothetical protein
MNRKKILGWLSVIFSSLFLLLFAIFLIIIILSFLVGTNSYFVMPINDTIVSALWFVCFTALFIFLLKNGRKMIKKPNNVEIIEYSGNLNINYTGKIAYKDYRNYVLERNFKRPFYLIFIGMIVLVSITTLLQGWSMDTSSLIFLSVFVLLVPILNLMQIRKIYNTNQAFHEELTYNLDNECINIKGDTVDSTTKWTRLYKITENKQFFVLFHDAMVANFIDKKLLTDAEIHEFREFIKSLNLREKAD